MRIYSIFLLFVVQVWNMPWACADYATSNRNNPLPGWLYYQFVYLYIVTTPVVQHLVTGSGIRVIPHLFEMCWSLILVQQIFFFYINLYLTFFWKYLVDLTKKKWVSTVSVSRPIALVILGYPLLECFPQ